MKMQARDLAGYAARPDAGHAGVLLFGADAMRVALKRQALVKGLIGPEGEAEMRLTRLQGADLRGDPAALLDSVKAQGFFPGARAVLIEDATDTLTDALSVTLKDWTPEDARLVVTAGNLKPASKLRKLFEGARNAAAVGIYDDPPGRDEIDAMLRDAGMGQIAPEAMGDIQALARALDPGDFRQTVEKLALYKLGDDTPLTPEDVAACAPISTEAGLDALLDLTAQGQAARIGPVLRRLQGQGVAAVTICIGAARHFRTLFEIACDPGGPDNGIKRLRPPLHWKRRDAVQAQLGQWSRDRLEEAQALLVDTDLTLRSGAAVPSMAVMERTLIRLAMLARRGSVRR